MVLVRVSAFAALVACVLASAPRGAALAGGGTLYALITPPSGLEVGCLDPCACPVWELPTYGSFELVRTGFDALYTYYRVERYIASFNDGPGAVSIVGSGTYKIGGEFALMQQMTLDLVVWDGPLQHFDSGLKPVSAPFPAIDIACAAHGFYCYDSVVVVHAGPTNVASVPRTQAPAGIVSVRPNPFSGQAAIAFTLDHPGPVDLMVVDVGGRRLSTLAAGQDFGAGLREAAWNGRRDDGRAVPAGVYWVVLHWSDGIDRRRIVKLE